jgi:CreA protein
MKKLSSINHSLILSLIVALIAFSVICSTAWAETIGESKSSGLLLKDTISVNAFDDPDYSSIVCYTTNVEIGGPNLENPSNSSISCRMIDHFKGTPKSRNDVFSKAKSPFFKKLTVDRFYDKKRNVLVYLSYTKKMSGSNASHSVSVVPLGIK